MKKIININLASRLIPIEDSAYEILRQYLDSLKRYFAREEGADEIVSDIESRIAELFQDKLKKGAHCITDEDVQAMKSAMGTPEQFDGGTESGTQEQGAAQETLFDKIRPRKRLYRDPDSKVLGGVCGGLGAYLNVDPVVFRIIFALLAIGGFGTGILIYFIIWVATPEATTATEKLEMRGERIDVNNIKATVQDEIQAMKGHLKNVGDDVRNFSQGRGRQVGNDIERFVRNLVGGLVKVFVLLTKGFFYFFAAIILLVLFCTGIGIAVASPVLFPLKDLLLSGTIQNLLFWPALILIIGIPIVGLVIFLIRKLTGIKETNRYVGYTLSFFFFVGVILALMVITSIGNDFRAGPAMPVKEKISVMQPSGKTLVIKRAEDISDMDEIGFFDGGLRMTDDTVIIGDLRVRLEKSSNDSFQVEVQRSSRGRTFAEARRLAQEISFQITQQDSVLYLPSGFSIPRNSKYRNQRVLVIIKVPVGKHINVDSDVRNHYDFGYNWRDNDRWNDTDDDLEELEMTTEGLNNIHTEKKPDNHTDKDSLENNYRYENSKKKNTTPVEDSGEHTQPATKAEIGIDVILYSLYHLAK
ncbi:phage shock protein C (PspC) family protein [Chitinophaga sp. CF118]|uniref:PspC domain-containing protein n=1 Tax=Chitinophaga sp. CF118 TaxID=1884367 RepID=UPI0008E6A507|nr:PspC domain-containing protein [Chitinophaga sp. CF118]SFE68411.1 phage shock protein C (PspC) family protein [Chitinophaga sp. CF118]